MIEFVCLSLSFSQSPSLRLNETIEFDIAAIKILFVWKKIKSTEREKSRKNYGVQSRIKCDSHAFFVQTVYSINLQQQQQQQQKRRFQSTLLVRIQ